MAYLSLSLLGPFQAWTANGSLQSFRTLKERALLAYLAVENSRAHRREDLAELFWPDRSEGVARNNLRQALYGIRQVIGDEGFDTIFTVTVDEIRFNLSEHAWLDLAAFNMHLQAAQAHKHNQVETCSRCLQQLRDAVEIYRGNFLEDLYLEKNQEFQDWVVIHREHFFRQQMQVLENLIVGYERSEEYNQAVVYALRQLQLDDIKEENYRRLIRLLAKTGRYSAAIELYEACRHRLMEALGVEPDEQTTALVEEIRSGRFDPGMLPRQDLNNNLPEQLTPFFGREMELYQIASDLDDPACRLLTLTGPGGVGKTRLAVQAAFANLHVFPDGVFFVPLERVSSADQLIEAISTAMGLTTGSQPDGDSPLFAYLRPRHVLIVLDNFEHLLEGRDVLLKILQSAQFVKILLTSRERLNYQAEHILEITGLPFPDKNLEDAEEVRRYAAVRLFLERASRVRSNHRSTQVNTAVLLSEKEAIVRICQLVDGLPLGIELAASWARDFTCDIIANEIQNSLDFLETSFHDLPERHRSLRAAFEHSWDLLTESEREVFCKLSIFPGSFTSPAAKAVAGAALPWLMRLEDKSLVRRAGYGRYDLHPLLRQFAGQKLRQYSRKIEETALQAHAEFFCAYLAERSAGLKGQRQAEALNEIDLEQDNVRAAWDWAVDRCSIDLLENAAFSLFYFHEARSRWSEGEERFAHAVNSLKKAPSRGMAGQRVLAYLQALQGWFCCRTSNFEQAKVHLVDSVQLLSSSPADFYHSFTHFALGFLLVWMGNFTDALRHLSTSLSLSEQIGDEWARAWSRELLVEIAFESGRSGFTEAPFLDTLAMFNKLGEQRGVGRVLNYLGNIAMAQGKIASAQQYFEKMLSCLEQVGDTWGSASGYSKLGRLSALNDDYQRAWGLAQQSFVLVQKTGDQRRTAYVLSELGEASAALDRMPESESYYHQALEIASRTRTLPLGLEVLTSISATYIKKQQFAQAVRLLQLVLANGVVDPLTTSRARQLLEKARIELVELPPASDLTIVSPAMIWEQVDAFCHNGRLFS